MAGPAYILPAPVGGWDTRSALSAMKPDRAVIMDNWVPGSEKVTLRRGSEAHATGMTNDVDTLIPYVATTGTGKLFAVNAGNIYDVSSAGAVGAAAVTGLSNSRWQYCQMTTTGGQFLFCVNGADAPRTYDGSAWAATALSASGLTQANLIWCNTHQRRLWFGMKESLSAWYLAVNSISGTVTEFPLGGLAKKGGYIMAMGTWSRDAGDGPDDAAVFLTSEGEVILYSGTDPASAWSLVGVFSIGKPIGRRCMIKAGADLLMLTQDGVVSAASILTMDRTQVERVALTAQINPTFNASVRDYKSSFGWEPFLYPKGAMLIVNVPQASEYHQYIFNTLTGAPSRFTGLDAKCWALLNDNAYFGTSDGRVVKFDTGTDDDGDNIEGDLLQAFTDFGTPGRVKRFTEVEPIFQSVGNPNAALDMNVDFQIAQPTATAQASAVSSARWGVSKWGIGTWGSDTQIYKGRRGVRGLGRTGALRIRVSDAYSRPSLLATYYYYTLGGAV